MKDTVEPPLKRRRKVNGNAVPEWERSRSFRVEEKKPASLPVFDENGSVHRTPNAPSFVAKAEKKSKKGTSSNNESPMETEIAADTTGSLLKKRKRVGKAGNRSTSLNDISKMKAMIAGIASKVVASPEENLHLLKELRKISQSMKGHVAVLAILTEAKLFTDIAPAYKIRALSKKESDVKVSKQVARLRQYEESLLSHYKRFVTSCTSICRWRPGTSKETSATRDMSKVRRAACKALAELIRALPHFNEAHTIAIAVCRLTMDREEVVRQTSADALRDVLSDAHRASGSVLEVCVAIAKTLANSAVLKVRVASEEVIAPLTSIQFVNFPLLPLSEKKKPEPKKSRKIKKRRKRTAAKLEKENIVDENQLDRDLREGDAEATPQELFNARKTLLDSVCHAYFNVIRSASKLFEDASRSKEGIHVKHRKTLPALSPALKGLLRVSTYVNTDVIEAILAALVPLLEESRLPLPTRFRSLSAAYAVLGMHSRAKDVDPDSFTRDARGMDNSLYSGLGELYGLSMPPKDVESVTYDAVEAVLAASSFRQIPSVRCAAFARRLAIIAASAAPTHACTMGLIHAAKLLMSPSLVTCIYKQKGEDFEGGEAGIDSGLIQKFVYGATDPEIANAERSASWELASLCAHFHPSVRDTASSCSRGMCGSALPNNQDNVVMIAKSHSSEKGGFNPAPAETLPGNSSKKTREKAKLMENELLMKLVPDVDQRMKLVQGESDSGDFFSEHFCDNS